MQYFWVKYNHINGFVVRALEDGAWLYPWWSSDNAKVPDQIIGPCGSVAVLHYLISDVATHAYLVFENGAAKLIVERGDRVFQCALQDMGAMEPANLPERKS